LDPDQLFSPGIVQSFTQAVEALAEEQAPATA
jgi:hypothetical protein